MSKTPIVNSTKPIDGNSLPGRQLVGIVARWLDDALKAQNRTPADMERATGISRQHVGTIRRGELTEPPGDKLVRKLAEALGIETPVIAWLDHHGNPRADWAAPDPARELAMKVGRAVAEAIQETIEKNELWYPGDGLRDLIASLYQLAGDFTARGVDATDIRVAIGYLEGKQKRGPRTPEGS